MAGAAGSLTPPLCGTRKLAPHLPQRTTVPRALSGTLAPVRHLGHNTPIVFGGGWRVGFEVSADLAFAGPFGDGLGLATVLRPSRWADRDARLLRCFLGWGRGACWAAGIRSPVATS